MSVAAPPSVVGDELTRTWLSAHHEERRTRTWALIGALLVHALILILPLPDFPDVIRPAERHNFIRVRHYIPPPPPLERAATSVTRRPRKRLLAVPDPTPDELEPIREPVPDHFVEPAVPELELLIGEPEPPPVSSVPETIVAGLAGVTDPVLIDNSRVKPVYPELARRARLEGRLILQALISTSGEVGELEILHCSLPGVGFEQAALDAVSQWRYTPGTYRDRPVGVVLTVKVNFLLVEP